MSRKNSLNQKAVRRMLKKMRTDKRYHILGNEPKYYSIVLTKNYPKVATSCFKLVKRDKSYQKRQTPMIVNNKVITKVTKPLKIR